MVQTAQAVIDFWFNSGNEEKRFAKDDAFDAEIESVFGSTWLLAKQGGLAYWRSTLEGRLAEIIVLDQFSRNLMRGRAEAFEQDLAALVLAQELVAHDDFDYLPLEYKQFALMPYMHSESAVIQEKSVELFENLGMEESLDYAIRHKVIIDRFGRYPHRNEAIGRETTVEEAAFLQEPNSSF